MKAFTEKKFGYLDSGLQENVLRMRPPNKLKDSPHRPLFQTTLSIIGGVVGRGTALQATKSQVRFPIVSLEFFIDIILPAALWPWGPLSLQ